MHSISHFNTSTTAIMLTKIATATYLKVDNIAEEIIHTVRDEVVAFHSISFQHTAVAAGLPVVVSSLLFLRLGYLAFTMTRLLVLVRIAGRRNDPYIHPIILLNFYLLKLLVLIYKITTRLMTLISRS